MVRLRDAGVDSPRRDCMVLAEDLLEKDRSWVNAHGEHELTTEQVKHLNNMIDRRANREPLAYIRGKAWFYKRFFKVTPEVLIPRPESENFIELLLELRQKTSLKNPCVADIGTGSGALGVTAALEIPGSDVHLYDIDPAALEIAKQNAELHGLGLKCYESDLLAGLQHEYDVILANLPYVPEDLVTSPEIKTEPELALFSGPDGLDHYHKFWQQITKLKRRPRYILTESLETQHEALTEFAKLGGYELQETKVLVQVFRIK